MVAWMGFTLFLDCVYYTLIKKQDPRESMRGQVYDETESTCFDFVADTGDGIRATRFVAQLMSCENQMPKKGDFIIHGGDICYPFPTISELTTRFLTPYTQAFKSTKARMYFALGNHEYTDGLIMFQEQLLPLCEIGTIVTPQQTTYYALKLSHGWWVFVIDLGPEPEDINESQLKYFESIPRGNDDRIILVYHTPDWIKVPVMGFSGMKRLRAWRSTLGSSVRLVIAGDLHYYRRMEDDRGTTYLIAGHGGAFSHCTHFPSVQKVQIAENHYLSTVTEYPTSDLSRKQWDDGWMFMFHQSSNVVYARFLAAVYVGLFVGKYAAIVSGLWLVILNLVLCTTSQYTGTSEKKAVAIGLAVLHSIMHGGMVYLIKHFVATQSPVIDVCCCYALGLIVSPFISALYFRIAVEVFHWHYNEAIAVVQCEGNKGFCRFKLEENGSITVYSMVSDDLKSHRLLEQFTIR